MCIQSQNTIEDPVEDPSSPTKKQRSDDPEDAPLTPEDQICIFLMRTIRAGNLVSVGHEKPLLTDLPKVNFSSERLPKSRSGAVKTFLLLHPELSRLIL